MDAAYSAERVRRRDADAEHLRERHRGHGGRCFAEEALRGFGATEVNVHAFSPSFPGDESTAASVQ